MMTVIYMRGGTEFMENAVLENLLKLMSQSKSKFRKNQMKSNINYEIKEKNQYKLCK